MTFMKISILLVLLVAVQAVNYEFEPTADDVKYFGMRNTVLRTILDQYIGNFTEGNITIEGCSYDDLVADFDVIDAKVAIWATENISFADFAEAR